MGDAVEFGLESVAVGLFLIEREFSSLGVVTKVSHIQFNMLSSEFLLVGLELQKLLAIDHSATTSATTSTCSTWGSERYSRSLSVNRDDAIKPGLGLSFRCEALGRFESGGEKEDTIRARRSKTPSLSEIAFNGRGMETTRHLATDKAQDEA